MCEANVYLVKNGNEDIIFESVDLFEAQGPEIRLVSLFGEEKRIQAKVKYISLVDHKIVLEPVS